MNIHPDPKAPRERSLYVSSTISVPIGDAQPYLEVIDTDSSW